MRFGDDNDIKETQETQGDTQLEIEEKFEMINEELKRSPEVIKIAKELDVSDLNSIMHFGIKI